MLFKDVSIIFGPNADFNKLWNKIEFEEIYKLPEYQ